LFDVVAIVTIIERGKGDKVVDVSKKAGATGATVFYGRGTGELEAKQLFNIHVESMKEIVLILAEKSKEQAIKDAIVEAINLKKPGKGVIFTVPVSSIIGLHHRDN
jgi:nitrogen regulatory protein PII